MSMKSESGVDIPIYGDEPEKPGLYLVLFHGRGRPQQQMNDWGCPGPMIGPLEWCHTTYAIDLCVLFETEEDEKRYFVHASFPNPQYIEIVSDLACYGNTYYGDWSVFVVRPYEIASPDDTFRVTKRRSRPSANYDVDREEHR